MSYQTITFETADGVAVLTLSRPDKLNAFTEEMHAEIARAMDTVEGDTSIRVLVITGAGRAFSSGQDLSSRIEMVRSGELDLGAGLDRWYNPLIRRIRALELPVIAAVNGVAAGAGANLALACDIVLAGRSASFIQAFARIGLVPDCGGTWTLPRLVGRARALGLALTADEIDAETAAEWGLIWRVVDDGQLMDEARAMAARFAKGPTAGYGAIKRAIDASAGNTLDRQLDLERDLQRARGEGTDYVEGITAFVEKRKPEFKGR